MMIDLQDEQDNGASLRLALYGLLVAWALASLTARILQVQSREGDTPFLSANDRSRWCTISALVDFHTYEIDRVRTRPGWQTIDMVRHRGRDGRWHYYSSKPTLLPTLLAAPYGILRTLTGVAIEDHPFYVGRLTLFLANVVPLALYFLLLVIVVEACGETNWGRVFVIASSAWGTFLTTFGVTLNNHLPAAVGVMVTVFCFFRIWNRESPHWAFFALAGLAAALTAANELPALSFLVATGTGLFWLSPRWTGLAFLPAVAVVIAGFFGTNYLAHQSLLPAYAHRVEGDNWYEYPGSYWIDGNQQGIDRGEPSRSKYALHVLLGHHGILSLTPIWWISMLGLAMWLFSGRGEQRALAVATIAMTVVCLVFYILLRPVEDRNYGGITCGFRWMFWFTPLWLIGMVPAADWISESLVRRIVALVLLAVSILSVNYASLNPWSHPWLYDYWRALGWL